MLHQEVELFDRHLDCCLPQHVEQQPLRLRHENHTLLLITGRLYRQRLFHSTVVQEHVELVRG